MFFDNLNRNFCSIMTTGHNFAPFNLSTFYSLDELKNWLFSIIATFFTLEIVDEFNPHRIIWMLPETNQTHTHAHTHPHTNMNTNSHRKWDVIRKKEKKCFFQNDYVHAIFFSFEIKRSISHDSQYKIYFSFWKKRAVVGEAFTKPPPHTQRLRTKKEQILVLTTCILH
jgi:hypothetical protein